MPVTPVGFDILRRNLKTLEPNTLAARAEFMRVISESAIKLLRMNTPKETGELANSWYEASRTPNTVIISVPDSQTKKLQYIIFGTKDHNITPRGQGYPLHWKDPRTGKDIYTMKVHHPGTQPNNFVASVANIISLNMQSVMIGILKPAHPYYRGLPNVQSYGFGNLLVPKGKGLKTPSDIVGLTGLKYVRRRGRGRSYIGRITLKGPKLTRRVGVGRRRT